MTAPIAAGRPSTSYVEAIRDRDFIEAATSGGKGKIALTYVEWSGPLLQKIVVPWRVIDGPRAAADFATALEAEPPETGRGTSISAAIRFGAALLQANEFEGQRKAIDVSGDGPNNYGPPVAKARDAAVAEGIVINGLPILLRPSPIVPDACNNGEFPPLPLAAEEGVVYKQLVAQTGGVFYDLCLQDFDPAWPKIAALDTSLFRDGFEGF